VPNLTIKLKLLLMGGMTGGFLILLGLVSFFSMNTTNAQLEQLYQGHLLGTEKIGRISELMRDNRIQLLLAAQHDPRNPSSKLHDHQLSIHTDQVAKNIEEITSIWEAYKAIPNKNAEQKRLEDVYAEARAKFVNDGLKPTGAALAEGDFDKGVILTEQAVTPLATTAFKAANEIYANEYSLAKASYELTQKTMARARVLILIVILLAMLLGTLINLAVIRSITRGMSELSAAAGRMAEGDLSSSLRIDSSDEIGTAARSFNMMRDAFVDLLGKVSSSAVQVASSASTLNNTAEQMATGAEQAAVQAGTVATASEEMAATSGEIAMNSQMAAEGAQQANRAALNGASVVQNTLAMMNQIAARSKESSAAVESLGNRSDQIGAIVVTIQDIAEQTNLLALNAAIEAARAGEQGRGFAVVADEVRALAERTTRATREIGEMIRAIQVDTKGAVAAMEQGVAQVEAGTIEAAKSEGALQQILDQINAVTMQVNQIATAAEQQTATTSEISSNILQITEVAQGTANGAHNSATAANKLASLAEELQRLVGQFRI